jgi:hypothetical protein
VNLNVNLKPNTAHALAKPQRPGDGAGDPEPCAGRAPRTGVAFIAMLATRSKPDGAPRPTGRAREGGGGYVPAAARFGRSLGCLPRRMAGFRASVSRGSAAFGG